MSSFASIENISTEQVAVSNTLLVTALYRTLVATKDVDLRATRQEAFDKYCTEVRASPVLDAKTLIETWWAAEQKFVEQSQIEGASEIDAQMLYRLTVLFLRNHVSCPFQKSKRVLFKSQMVADTSDFEEQNKMLFTEFLNHSLSHIAGHKVHEIRQLAPALQRLSKSDIDRIHYSSSHKLLDKDTAILKGGVIGLASGVVVSMFAGPIIGTAIGEAAGLSGAAATSYGLALLGGGSLASGGFGMAGGSIVIGVAVGGFKAAGQIGKNVDPDLLSLALTAKNLPILLTAGRLLQDLDHPALTHWIHKRIVDGLFEAKIRLKELSTTEDNEKSRNSVEKKMALLERANEMSVNYDWFTAYDAYRKVLSL